MEDNGHFGGESFDVGGAKTKAGLKDIARDRNYLQMEVWLRLSEWVK